MTLLAFLGDPIFLSSTLLLALAGGACALLGFLPTLRKNSFSTLVLLELLALQQTLTRAWLPPAWDAALGLVACLIGAWLLLHRKENPSASLLAFVGVASLAALAASWFHWPPEGSERLHFGNLLSLPESEMKGLSAALAICILLLLLLFRPLLRAAAEFSSLRSRLLAAFFWGTSVWLGSRALGSLTLLVFLSAPPLVALLFRGTVLSWIVVSLLVALGIAGGGSLLAWGVDLPPTVVAAALGCLLVLSATAISSLRKG